MGNITETTHFENLQETLEYESFIDEVTMASYESEVDLDRDNTVWNEIEEDVITDHLDEVTEVEQMEADAELYFEGMGHA